MHAKLGKHAMYFLRVNYYETLVRLMRNDSTVQRARWLLLDSLPQAKLSDAKKDHGANGRTWQNPQQKKIGPKPSLRVLAIMEHVKNRLNKTPKRAKPNMDDCILAFAPKSTKAPARRCDVDADGFPHRFDGHPTFGSSLS